ncbi:FAD-dependent oxidoreductase [Streptomyces sp. NPDC048516]|uniref:FAD-dependent oxidoreductase n=1 Tax=Streptomyces sp. NPDC048516 TaxID=3365565 RepID=UPI00370FD0AF
MNDLIVIGAGPAGCAAAVMAASLGQHVTVVETDKVGGKLHQISALENVPGAWATGPALAQALAADLARIQHSGRCTLIEGRAISVAGHDDRAEAVLKDGQVLAAAAVIVATGVAAVTPATADWIAAPDGLDLPPLWRARPEELRGRTYVLGGDRPLGTWLRSHPGVTRRLHVLYPAADHYKTDEVRGDDRVRLSLADRVTVARERYGDGYEVVVEGPEGRRTFAVDTLVSNLGSLPAALDGLVQDPVGYCPPTEQHPRILTAGDLRSGRFQRIVTAQGSGAEAALERYYAAKAPAANLASRAVRASAVDVSRDLIAMVEAGKADE